MNRTVIIIATVAFSWFAVVTTQAANCDSAKLKCVSKKATGLLKCHAKAEKAGTVVDPVCTSKVMDKFDGGSTPVKGCVTKAEAKGSCTVTGSTATLDTAIDIFVLSDIVPALDSNFPGPIPGGNVCSAKKKLCVAKKATGLLKCHAKAIKKGLAADPLCLQRAMDKFDGGSIPSKGCFAKLEAKGGCLTVGDTPAIEAVVNAFVEDTTCHIAPSSCPLVCGNGVLDPGEGCDDGNLTSGDGCDNNCTVTLCGNGLATPGEQCDEFSGLCVGGALEGTDCTANAQCAGGICTSCPSTGVGDNCGNDCVCNPALCCDIDCSYYPGFGSGCFAAGGSVVGCDNCQLTGDCCQLGSVCLEGPVNPLDCTDLGGTVLGCNDCVLGQSCCDFGGYCAIAGEDDCDEFEGTLTDCSLCSQWQN